MSAKEQRRQKKLAKKRTKDLAKKKQIAREKNVLQSFSGQVQVSAKGAVDRCLISESLLDPEQKFGSILLSRKMPDGRVLFVRSLVDGMCLGVKDADASTCFPSMLSEMVDRITQSDPLRDASPNTAKKLLESVVAFSGKFGFQPHPLYEKTRLLWEDIDATQCDVEFKFGNDGKPHFISGPHDTADTIAEALLCLERSVGEGNYDFTVEQGGGLDDGLYEYDENFSPMIDDSELDVDIDEDIDEDIDGDIDKDVVLDSSPPRLTN
jgi:hypothetical protein